MMDPGVRKKDAYIVQTRRCAFREIACFLSYKDDGTLRRQEHLLFRIGRFGVFFDGIHISHHYCEGFVFPPVPFAHSVYIFKTATYVHSAPSFYHGDGTRIDKRREFFDRIVADFRSVLQNQPVARSAQGTADGLVVKSAVGRISVFGLAFRTHGKR